MSVPTSLKDKAVGFLGAGNMGEAIIKGLLQTGLVPASSIAATDARADRLQQMASQYGIRGLASNRELVAGSDVVILAVKPQIMARCSGRSARVAAGAADLGGGRLPVAALREALGKPARLIRVMPNTPALVLEGVTAIRAADGPRRATWSGPGAVRRGGARGGARRGRSSTRSPGSPAQAPPTCYLIESLADAG